MWFTSVGEIECWKHLVTAYQLRTPESCHDTTICQSYTARFADAVKAGIHTVQASIRKRFNSPCNQSARYICPVILLCTPCFCVGTGVDWTRVRALSAGTHLVRGCLKTETECNLLAIGQLRKLTLCM